MLELAQQLSMYLSVVDGGATSKLVSYGQQIASVGVLAQTARASIEQIIAPIHAVSAAWASRETQINNIARTLRQYEYAGQSIADINRDIARSMPDASTAQRGAAFTRVYQNQFEQARLGARGIMGTMNEMAAKLPGEAADYMQSFSMNLPFLSGARGMTTGRASILAGYLTAGGIAGGVDAQQSSRDLMQFLTVGPHMTDRSWVEVWSQYATYRGKKVDANRIRGMTRDQRVEVLENIANQLQPMMDAMQDSFEATMGTFKSFQTELKMQATEPIFDAFKSLVAQANQGLAVLARYLGPLGQYFGTLVGGVIRGFGNHFKGFESTIVKAGPVIAQWASRVTYWFGVVADGASLIYGKLRWAANGVYSFFSLLIGQSGGALGGLRTILPSIMLRFLGASLGPVGYILSSLLIRMFENGSLGNIFNSLKNLFVAISPIVFVVLGGLYKLANAVLDIAAGIIGTYLPIVLDGLAYVITNLIAAFTVFYGTFSAIAGPLFSALFGILGFVLSVVKNVFMGLIGNLVMLVVTIAQSLWNSMALLWSLVREPVLLAIEALSMFAQQLGRILNPLADAPMTVAEGAATQLAPTASWIEKAMAGVAKSAAVADMRGRAPPNQRPHTNQDFRYSRFDITQKFAEGFDPDRVASAMASELSAMSEQQLQSGFQPAFTTV